MINPPNQIIKISSKVTANISPNSRPIRSKRIEDRKPIKTRPIARDECAKRPSNESPANFVLFCRLSRSNATTPEMIKTDKEILSFNQKLGEALPYIPENGSAIKGLNLINKNLPKELILSKEKEELINIFENEVPEDLKIKCKWIAKMNKENQLKTLGLPEDLITNALDRKYTVPFIFDGNKNEINQLSKILKLNQSL